MEGVIAVGIDGFSKKSSCRISEFARNCISEHQKFLLFLGARRFRHLFEPFLTCCTYLCAGATRQEKGVCNYPVVSLTGCT